MRAASHSFPSSCIGAVLTIKFRHRNLVVEGEYVYPGICKTVGFECSSPSITAQNIQLPRINQNHARASTFSAPPTAPIPSVLLARSLRAFAAVVGYFLLHVVFCTPSSCISSSTSASTSAFSPQHNTFLKRVSGVPP